MTRVREFVLRAGALLGLGASAILFVDHTRPAPLFCEKGGGCDLARQSSFAHVLGIPTPILGMAFFMAFLLLSLLPGARIRRLLTIHAGIGAAAAAGFIAVQVLVLHALCKYCMVTDVTAVALFGLVLAGRKATPAPVSQQSAWLYGIVALAFGGGPFLVPAPAPPQIPTIEPIPKAVEIEKRSGVVTIVEFFNFECPHCRAMNATLSEVLKPYGTRIRLVRKHLPMPGHSGADLAARVACCADEEGLGDAVADELLRSDDLSAAGCEALVARAGANMTAFRACMESERPKARLVKDSNDADEANVRLLPTLWIHEEKFIGALAPETIRASIDRAFGQIASRNQSQTH